VPTLSLVIARTARTCAWLLALALLLSAGWGQMHRVLHAGAQTHAVRAIGDVGKVATAQASDSQVAGLSHEEGGPLCQLLDQLSLGAGVACAPWPAWHSQTPMAHAQAKPQPVHQTLKRAFAARGPPLFT